MRIGKHSAQKATVAVHGLGARYEKTPKVTREEGEKLATQYNMKFFEAALLAYCTEFRFPCPWPWLSLWLLSVSAGALTSLAWVVAAV